MADVANCMNASTPTKTHLGQIIPDSQDSVVLSPGVKEAMDRIFPRSATQLLQGGLSFGEDQLFNVASLRDGKETLQSRNSPFSTSLVDTAPPQYRVSAPHISTFTTTDTAAASFGVVPSASRNGSVLVNSSPGFSTGWHRPAPMPLSNDKSKDAVDSISKPPLESQKNVQPGIRISKADFEIVTSCDALISEYERTSRRVNCADVSSSECHSGNDSDSEDMRRPFATIAREKKRRKKRKKQIECNIEKASGGLSEHYANSDDEFQTSKSWKTNDKSASITDSGNNRTVSPSDIISQSNTVKQNTHHELLSCIQKNSLGFNDNMKDNCLLNCGPVKDAVYKDCGMTSEDISNISYSSSKENVHGMKRHMRQKLPKTKRQRFHIVKHVNKIRNTFPPCFVVLKKADDFLISNTMKDFNVTDNVLPLAVRVKNLTDLCNRGTLPCRKNGKMDAAEEVLYKKVFDDNFFYGLTDDDFEKPRVRSLRKRDKNISYVEPSEDDIVDEFSRKRSRTKNSDSYFGKSGDESSSESKKRKKQDKSKTSAAPCGNTDNVAALDKNKGDSERGKRIMEKDGQRNTPKEVMVYPPPEYNNMVPFLNRHTGSGMLPANIPIDTSQHMMYLQDKANNMSMVPPAPSHISVLPGSAMPGAFPSHAAPVSLFPSLPLSFPGLPPPAFVGGAPTPCQVSPAGGPHNPQQYYLVRMNGKDVILRFVPSGGMGTPMPMALPKEKALYVPPSPAHMNSHPVRQPHPIPVCTQPMMRPVTSIATAAHGNDASAAALQSLYGIPMLPRPAHTNIYHPPLPTLPVIQPAHLSGHASAPGTRPISHPASDVYSSQSSGTGLPAPIFASPTSGTPLYVRPVTTSTLSTPALPALAPMPSTNTTTTLARSVPVSSGQEATPNQSSSVRIFVPGCSSTGAPGRFATLGNLANSSPLVRLQANSSLLPECKRSSDQDLTPEQRAAKRRKLERKYPLPPGVVIKTEPLDSPPKPPTSITSRSLLSTSLQLLSTSRPGSGVQSFRIIAPSLTGALSLRNIRGSSDIVYRTASVGGGQTVLVPTSVGLLPTTTAATHPSTPISSCASAVSSASNSLYSTTVTKENAIANPGASFAVRTLLNTDALSSSRASNSPQLFSQSSQSGATESNPSNISSIFSVPATGSSFFSLPSVVPSCESSASMNRTGRPSSSFTNIAAESLPPSGTSSDTWPHGNTQPQQSRTQPEAACLDSVKASLEELRKIVLVQESRGLQGDRLDKLRELLQRKEQHYQNLQILADVRASSTVYSNDIDSREFYEGGGERQTAVGTNEYGASDANPFVID